MNFETVSWLFLMIMVMGVDGGKAPQSSIIIEDRHQPHEVIDPKAKNNDYEDYAADEAPVAEKEKQSLSMERIQDYLYNIRTNVLHDNDQVLTTDSKKDITKFISTDDLKPSSKEIEEIRKQKLKRTKTEKPLLLVVDDERDSFQSDQPYQTESNQPTANSRVSNYQPQPQPQQPRFGPNPNSRSNDERQYRRPYNPNDRIETNSNFNQYNQVYPKQQTSNNGDGQMPRQWICQFTSYSQCNITNDPSISGQPFQLKSYNFFSYRNFEWPSWYLMLNNSLLEPNQIGARLITPYLPSQQVPKGCLSIEYITMGNEIDKVLIYQQDNDNHCLWSSTSKNTFQENVPIVNVVDLGIDLNRGDPRFFIETYLKRPNNISGRNSVLALSKLILTYKPCQNDQKNFCRAGSNSFAPTPNQNDRYSPSYPPDSNNQTISSDIP